MGSWLGRRGRGGRGRWRWRWRRWRGGGGGSWLLWCGGFEEGGFSLVRMKVGGRGKDSWILLEGENMCLLNRCLRTYVPTWAPCSNFRMRSLGMRQARPRRVVWGSTIVGETSFAVGELYVQSGRLIMGRLGLALGYVWGKIRR